MADGSTFGGESAQPTFGDGLNFDPQAGVGGPPVMAYDGGDTPAPTPTAPPDSAPTRPEASFGGSLKSILPGRFYTPPDPQATALDQTADVLQQRVQRANSIATNPLAQLFAPEAVQKARDFAPQATEALQKIKQQKADMAANRQQAENLGLAPGETADEATQADRVEVAKAKALSGDLKVFKGLQAVDPKAAEAIQDQVHEAVAGHLTNAQLAFDSLAGMQNQGQYSAKLRELRQNGTLTDLERLGLKVPDSFETFSSAKGREGQALREARIGVDTTRQKLEERNTYQPMEEKDAKTYTGRLTTAYGDQITNGTWSRNGAAGTRGLVVNGAADPRDLGKSFTLATPEQRKAIEEESDKVIPKEEREKYRAFNRTYQLATTDAKGNKLPDGTVNTNPNVQQGMAEGLASMLRGGAGGANIGLLKIETSKRGFIQGLIDKINTEQGAAMNELKGKDVNPYLSKLTQGQIRDVMDVLKQYNDQSIGERASRVAERAGALGLDAQALGYGGKETAGAINDALERGRQAQIARMMPNHQAIGGGDGVIQLGAQRPGVGATTLPAGTAPTTQQPGAAALTTPVQAGTQTPGPSGPAQVQPVSPPPPVAPPNPGGAPVPVAGQSVAFTPPPGVSPAPVPVAGQSVAFTPPPGVSPSYLASLQRIESGNEKNPWTATTKATSASGAYQFIKGTWDANKPAGAPARAADATPQQQTQALETLTAKNAASLQHAGFQVDDTNLYIAHNLGAGGAAALLRADPKADARKVVGETAARNNPTFFKGRPTVAMVLGRYQTNMAQDISDTVPRTTPDAPAAQPQGLMARIASKLASGDVPGGRATTDAARKDVADNGPAIGSTLGAVGGSAVAPGVGTVAGGAAGGAAGQALSDYLKGNAQSPTKIAKEAALGGVLGIAPEGRPLIGAATRVLGAGGVEAGGAAAEGGDAGDVVGAAAGGATGAAGGEAFGRALGMAGHKIWSWLAPDGKAALQSAAQKYHDADQVLKTEQPKLPGAAGQASSPNPKYDAAEKARDEAETAIKDIMPNAKPEELAYAHKVSSEGVPKQEAEVSRPAAMEKDRVGAGYQQMEGEVGAAGKGAVKATPKLADGPIAAVENKQVSEKHAELAQHTEAAITAPAKDWQEKWVQLKDARSALLGAERDALTSTATGRTREADDMRRLADTVRTQQAKVAKYVFGEKDGEAFMGRLKVLDTRYRNLMEATGGGDMAKAAAMKGEAGRDVDRKFRAFAHDDPVALSAWDAMRKGGSNVERDVRTLVGVEKIPVLGKAVSFGKMALSFNEWMRERAAGSPAKFEDFVPELKDAARRSAKGARDLGGSIGARAATM